MKINSVVLPGTALVLGLAVSVSAQGQTLNFYRTIELAQQYDNWQTRSNLQEQALSDRAISASQLPDPKLRVALVNLPTDRFDFNQENMTQLQLGISQAFPRGDSLTLRGRQLGQRAGLAPIARAQRQADVTRQVGMRWLNSWSAQAQIRLIEQNRALFQQLLEVAEANYRQGRSERHDLIRAELELSRLDDRIVRLRQQRDQRRGELARWLPLEQVGGLLPPQRPQLSLPVVADNPQHHALVRHPEVRLIDQQIEVASTGVKLADEAYKPGWTLSAQYGYRDDMDNGSDRADFASIAVTVDLPLFPEKRQDPQRRAAINDVQSLRESRQLTLRELHGLWRRTEAALSQLDSRLSLFQRALLPQFAAQRDAAMQSYASGTADFTEVMQAAIGELNTRLEQIRLGTERQLNLLTLNYLLTPANLLTSPVPE
ncbi:MAG: TolC family protein [Marinobacterium sp.]|nr:TolC family protein [Marinobacterium sp.]